MRQGNVRDGLDFCLYLAKTLHVRRINDLEAHFPGAPFAMIPLMFVCLRYLLGWVISVFRSREELLLDNPALRQQLLALCSASREPGLRLGGRTPIGSLQV